MNKQVILITGAAGKLGSCLAEYFSDTHTVIAHYHSKMPSCNAEEYIQADITNAIQVTKMIDYIETKYKNIDVLINNAAHIPLAAGFPIESEVWQHTFAVNVVGAINCAQAVFPYMKRNYHGVIVNIAARAGIHPVDDRSPAYAASKAALLNLTQSMAAAYSRDRIHVFGLAPTRLSPADNDLSLTYRDIFTALNTLITQPDVYEPGSIFFLDDFSRQISNKTDANRFIPG